MIEKNMTCFLGKNMMNKHKKFNLKQIPSAFLQNIYQKLITQSQCYIQKWKSQKDINWIYSVNRFWNTSFIVSSKQVGVNTDSCHWGTVTIHSND